METDPSRPLRNGESPPSEGSDPRAELETERAARRKAETALRDAIEHLRLVDREVTDYAIIQLDTDGRVVNWSAGAHRLYGYTVEEARGMSFSRLFIPEDVQKEVPARELREAAASGHSGDENWHLRKDGSRFWASGTLSAKRGPDGGLLGFVKICRDLTERREAREAMRESEHRLRIALDAARMGVWRWDARANEETVDENLYRLLGLTPGNSIRKLEDFLRRVHPEDRPGLEAEFHRCLRERTSLNVEFRVVWPDGTVHWLKDNGDVFIDEEGQVLYLTGICVDITRLKDLEAELRRRADELAEADRRKDEFIAMLGHELRNPLAAIASTVEVLRLRESNGAELDHYLEVIDRQLRHLTRMVDDLLDVARITRGNVELRKIPLDLGEAVRRAVEVVHPFADARRHEILVTAPSRAVWVDADPTRLEQVLANLLNNAAKYTDPGGHIAVSVGREGSRAVVRVRDTGKGIAPQHLEKIFDVFMQVPPSIDRAQGGLGLGLTLARRLVEMHGGTITAHSAGRGQGSEFVVQLPLAPVVPNAGGSASLPRRRPEDKVRRVLVVDDNVDVAGSLGDVLHRLGHEVRLAHGGAEALAMAAGYRPEVVLLDIGLPGMDGYEVARRLRQMPATADALLLAVTGYGQEQDQARAREAGFDYHLTKPVRGADLQRLLQTPRRRAGVPEESA